MGSGMSGGERGSRLGWNAQTHTCTQACTNTHIQVRTHTRAHRLSCLIGSASEIDGSHLFPVSVISLLFPLSSNSFFLSTLSLPISLILYQQVLDRIHQMGGQIGKLQHYGAQGLVNTKPGSFIDKTGKNRIHERTVCTGRSEYALMSKSSIPYTH